MKYVVFLLSFISLIANAKYSFQGDGEILLTNGESGIIEIEFKVSDEGGVEGNYRYKKFNIPVQLEGEFKEGRLVLRSNELNEEFIADINKNDNNISSLSGFWKNRTKKGIFKARANLPGVCTNSLYCENKLIERILAKVKISGDQQFCSHFLRNSLFYNKPDSSKKYKFEEVIGEIGLTRPLMGKSLRKFITSGTYSFDLNGDGTPENFIKINGYSGSGNGCNQEYFQQVNNSKNKILLNGMNEELKPYSCAAYYESFQYEGVSYIANRAAKLNGPDPDRINEHLRLLSAVSTYQDQKLKWICGYSY